MNIGQRPAASLTVHPRWSSPFVWPNGPGRSGNVLSRTGDCESEWIGNEEAEACAV